MKSIGRISFLCFAALVCFMICNSTYGLLSPQGVNFEVQALMGIKASLVDPHGVLDSWDENSVDPCSWTMVTCSLDNLVIGLDTPRQNLSGALSPSIGNLTNLQIVLLQNNNMSGSIPKEIGMLSKLHTLDFSNNLFTGTLPRTLAQLKSLQYLRLSNNNLSGSIPSTLAKMSQLTFLDLSYNNLSGPLPRITPRTFNIVGNPLICATGFERSCCGTMPMPTSFTLNESQSAQQSRRFNRQKVVRALGLSLAGICVVISAFGFLLWWKHSHNKQMLFYSNYQQSEEIRLGNLKRFSLKELQTATDNFSSKNLIGEGGFGMVYRGQLQDGNIVAIKRLTDGNTTRGEVQFEMEVEMMSLAVHRNLLRLHGFCMTTTEKLLVYPYMSNGSVASRLKEKPALDWSSRKKIALGAARGLVYLHEQCDPKIIHRDVKAANILLDEFCEAVVGDFGLAKLLDHQNPQVTTAVKGTIGHIAPEYLSTGQSSEKTDVFGFGILLLELITGKTTLEFNKAENPKGAMLDWVKKIHQDKNLDMLADKELIQSYEHNELEQMVRLALLCTQYLPGQRPRMSLVLQMLETCDQSINAEKWETSKRDITETKKCSAPNKFSSSERYSDLTDDFTLLVQEMELSGPR